MLNVQSVSNRLKTKMINLEIHKEFVSRIEKGEDAKSIIESLKKIPKNAVAINPGPPQSIIEIFRSLFVQAIKYGNEELVRYFVEEHKLHLKSLRYLDVDEVRYYNAILIATYNGQVHLVKYFSTFPDIDVNFKLNNGATALHYAMLNSTEEMVECLLQAKANVNARSETGETPIMIVTENNAACVQLLIKANANIRAADNRGVTALYHAAAKGNYDAFRMLHQAGASLKVVTKSGYTILLSAVKGGNLQILEYLDSLEIDFNEPSPIDGENALHECARNGNAELIQFLLKRKVEVNHRCKLDKTPLMWAVVKGYTDVVKLLVDSGANVNSIIKVTSSNHIKSAQYYLEPILSIACDPENYKTEIFKYLVQHGAEVQSSEDKEMLEPYFVALRYDNAEALLIMVDELYKRCQESKQTEPDVENKSVLALTSGNTQNTHDVQNVQDAKNAQESGQCVDMLIVFEAFLSGIATVMVQENYIKCYKVLSAHPTYSIYYRNSVNNWFLSALKNDNAHEIDAILNSKCVDKQALPQEVVTKVASIETKQDDPIFDTLILPNFLYACGSSSLDMVKAFIKDGAATEQCYPVIMCNSHSIHNIENTIIDISPLKITLRKGKSDNFCYLLARMILQSSPLKEFVKQRISDFKQIQEFVQIICNILYKLNPNVNKHNICCFKKEFFSGLTPDAANKEENDYISLDNSLIGKVIIELIRKNAFRQKKEETLKKLFIENLNLILNEKSSPENSPRSENNSPSQFYQSTDTDPSSSDDSGSPSYSPEPGVGSQRTKKPLHKPKPLKPQTKLQAKDILHGLQDDSWRKLFKTTSILGNVDNVLERIQILHNEIETSLNRSNLSLIRISEARIMDEAQAKIKLDKNDELKKECAELLSTSKQAQLALQKAEKEYEIQHKALIERIQAQVQAGELEAASKLKQELLQQNNVETQAILKQARDAWEILRTSLSRLQVIDNLNNEQRGRETRLNTFLDRVEQKFREERRVERKQDKELRRAKLILQNQEKQREQEREQSNIERHEKHKQFLANRMAEKKEGS